MRRLNIEWSDIALLVVGVLAVVILVKTFEIIREQEEYQTELNNQLNPSHYIPDSTIVIDTIA